MGLIPPQKMKSNAPVAGEAPGTKSHGKETEPPSKLTRFMLQPATGRNGILHLKAIIVLAADNSNTLLSLIKIETDMLQPNH